jgi:hypothetical protein
MVVPPLSRFPPPAGVYHNRFNHFLGARSEKTGANPENFRLSGTKSGKSRTLAGNLNALSTRSSCRSLPAQPF